MRAIVQDRYGSPEVFELRDVDKPIVGEDEVLVAVKAAGVNPADWHFMTGTPYIVRLAGGGLFRPKSRIPGLDVAGRVEAVGSGVTRFAPGDEVFGEVGRGYAEYVAIPERRIAHKPSNLTFEQAAAVPIAALTALQGLRDKGAIQPGHKVLVNGASGGVGTFAVQIAKSFGAEVTGVCSTRNVEMVRDLGADHIIDYSIDDFTTTGPYDLILDAVGSRPLSQCRRALTANGIYVGVGGPKTVLRLVGRMLAMALLTVVTRKRMTSMLARQTQEDLDVLTDLLTSGAVVPVIDRQFVLAEATAALHHQGEGHARGNSVIIVD